MKKFLFVGGDLRMRTARNEIRNAGFTTDTLGLFENDNGSIEQCDIIVLPVPTTRDLRTVSCPLTKRVILLDEISAAADDRLILSCGYGFEGKNCIDYGALDSYSLLNAVPTAEGAIAEAITRTDYTLWQSKVLIIGYGRVGKVLCDRLCGMKCDVTVSARKSHDFAMLDTLNIKHINTALVPSLADNYDIIFNTIDVPIFKDDLQKLKNTLIIDLSTKGCIDFKRAEELEIEAIKLPGIPGKTAPVTAGKILAQTVIELSLS